MANTVPNRLVPGSCLTGSPARTWPCLPFDDHAQPDAHGMARQVDRRRFYFPASDNENSETPRSRPPGCLRNPERVKDITSFPRSAWECRPGRSRVRSPPRTTQSVEDGIPTETAMHYPHLPERDSPVIISTRASSLRAVAGHARSSSPRAPRLLCGPGSPPAARPAAPPPSDRCRRRYRLRPVNDPMHHLPGLSRQYRLARPLGVAPRLIRQPQQPPGHDRVRRQRPVQALGRLQLQSFDPTAALEDVMIALDVPAIMPSKSGVRWPGSR